MWFPMKPSRIDLMMGIPLATAASISDRDTPDGELKTEPFPDQHTVLLQVPVDTRALWCQGLPIQYRSASS
jgi:hypothetical protein